MALRRPAFGIRKEQMYLKTLEAMKRLAILLMLVLFSVASVQAQFAKPLKTNQKKSKSMNQLCLGVTGSFAANDMVYSAVGKSSLKPFLAPTFGLVMEWGTFNQVSVGLEASYAMRGVQKSFATEFQNSFSSTTFARVNYAMSLNGVAVRVPIAFYLGKGENVRPYLFVAPRFDLWLNGHVRWERTYDDGSYPPLVYETELSKAVIKPYCLSAVVGVGLCSQMRLGWTRFFVKFDLGYGFSPMNSFSQSEIGGENGGIEFQGWGDIAHEHLGKRYLHNAEARLTFLWSLRRLVDDPCLFNQKPYKPR